MQDQPATPPCVKGRRRRSELVRRETGAAESEVGDLTEERKRIGNRIMDGGFQLEIGWTRRRRRIGTFSPS